MYTPPPYIAAWFAQNPQPNAAFNKVAAQLPALSAAQESAFASGQVALDGVKDAEAALDTYLAEVRDGSRHADKAFEAQAKSAIAQTRSVHEAAAGNTSRLTRVSSGTRKAFDHILKAATTLAGENASVELAKPIKLPAGKSAAEVVAIQREVLGALDDEVEAVQRALQPKSEALARAQAELAVEVRRGRLAVSAGGSVIWPMTPLPVRPMVGSEVVKIPDVVAIIAALNAEALERQIEQAVDRLYAGVPDEQQLSAPQKRARLAKIASQRFEAELVEVAAIFAAWAEGRADIGLRPDVDPLAVLGVTAWKANPVDRSLIHI